MAREGVFAGVDAELLPPIARPGLAALKLLGRKRAGNHGLSRAMEKLGPSYVKLGQFLATRPDIVSADVAHELERLQDRVAPLPRDVAVKRIEAAATGSPNSTNTVSSGAWNAASTRFTATSRDSGATRSCSRSNSCATSALTMSGRVARNWPSLT